MRLNSARGKASASGRIIRLTVLAVQLSASRNENCHCRSAALSRSCLPNGTLAGETASQLPRQLLLLRNVPDRSHQPSTPPSSLAERSKLLRSHLPSRGQSQCRRPQLAPALRRIRRPSGQLRRGAGLEELYMVTHPARGGLFTSLSRNSAARQTGYVLAESLAHLRRKAKTKSLALSATRLWRLQRIRLLRKFADGAGRFSGPVSPNKKSQHR